MEIKYTEKDEKKAMMDDEGYETIVQIIHEALGRPMTTAQKTLDGKVVPVEPVGLRSITLRDGTIIRFLEDAKWGNVDNPTQ